MSDEETIEILTELFDDVEGLQKEEIAKQQKQDEETIKILTELLDDVQQLQKEKIAKQQKQDEKTIEILTELFNDVQQLQKQEIAKQQKQDEETIQTLDEFLPSVSAIREKYAKQEEKEVTQFNVFSILYISKYEESQHSKLICSLLNPHAEHRQGAQFLRHFLQTAGLAEFFTEEEIANASIAKERFDIDILISSGSKAIIIENKIWAKYRDDQLI